MPIDAFMIQDTSVDNTSGFVQDFLSSIDFDQFLRRKIANQLNMEVDDYATKLAVTEAIIDAVRSDEHTSLAYITDAMFERRKPYFTIQVGYIPDRPTFSDARLLAKQRGNSEWYGAVHRTNDDNAVWYVRPIFFDYYENIVHENITQSDKYLVRWLVFARVSTAHISLHWRGFSSNKGLFVLGNNSYKGQFPYWNYIPQLFDEIIRHTHARVCNIDFPALILDTLWEEYRYNYDRYLWKDVRIRAEHRGIALNASAGAASRSFSETDYDSEDNDDTMGASSEDSIAIEGIEYLAKTIRKSVWGRLSLNNINLPQNLEITREIDDEILRTLIREYDPKSYECAIYDKEEKRKLFRGYSFFGRKPSSVSPDKFIHIRLREASTLGDIEQMQFLLSHLNINEHLIQENDDSDSPVAQLGLF